MKKCLWGILLITHLVFAADPEELAGHYKIVDFKQHDHDHAPLLMDITLAGNGDFTLQLYWEEGYEPPPAPVESFVRMIITGNAVLKDGDLYLNWLFCESDLFEKAPCPEGYYSIRIQNIAAIESTHHFPVHISAPGFVFAGPASFNALTPPPLGLVALIYGDQYRVKMFDTATSKTPLGTCPMNQYLRFHENAPQNTDQEEGKTATLQCLTRSPFQTKQTGYDHPYPLELVSYKYENERFMVALTKSNDSSPTEFLWIEIEEANFIDKWESSHHHSILKFTLYKGRMIADADSFTTSWNKQLYHSPGGDEWTGLTYPDKISNIHFQVQGVSEIGGQIWLQIGDIIDYNHLCSGNGHAEPSPHPLPYKGLWVPLTDKMGNYNVQERFVAGC